MRQWLSRGFVWYGLVLAAGAAWAVLAFLAPPTRNNFNLTTAQLDLLIVTIIVPVVAVWVVAVYGIRRLSGYARQIRAETDGAAMVSLARGLGWLVVALVVVQLLAALVPYARHDGNIETFSHVQLIVAALLYILAFGRIYLASDRLLSVSKANVLRSRYLILPLVGIMLLAVVYTYFVFHDSYRHTPPSGSDAAAFYLSDPFILWLVVVPYVVQWLLGILTAINVRAYAITVKGVIYRRAMQRLSNGVLAVVIFSVLIQVLVAISPDLETAGLQAVLLLIYALIVLYGLGFVWIALGVKRLTRIEEVTK